MRYFLSRPVEQLFKKKSYSKDVLFKGSEKLVLLE